MTSPPDPPSDATHSPQTAPPVPDPGTTEARAQQTAVDPRAVLAALDRLVGDIEGLGKRLADGMPVNCAGLDAKVAVLCQVAEQMASRDAEPIVARLAKLVAALDALGERLQRTGALEPRVGARAVAGAYAARSG
ncbi:MAG: hypothetical protein EAZ99_11930 [Alphaproteobacteria bacterium]|nr:MAG: hypothetical protein EAZ99_11930 [Alphaproteobacteria bacterium]